ncbi:MAG: hypothetical protein SPJ16_04830 [Helicobacter sp.]|nr:hypothetical protein [Helicobacter sp.]MDY5950500.1 hypothetical protein [Helicobacter sp.]
MRFKKSIKTSVLSLALISSMAYADGLKEEKVVVLLVCRLGLRFYS